MNSFACGIVTFNPDEEVVKKIKTYAENFDEVIVYDNTPGHSALLEGIEIAGVSIESNGINDGLSRAYNFILKKVRGSVDYLCFLDQDSLFKQEDIHNIKDCINLQSSNLEIDILGPLIIFNKTHEKIKLGKLHKVDFIISSGTFINLKSIFEKKIYFDENYFIDRVDLDFCTLCRKKGLKIYQYTGAKLYQRLGTGNKNEHSIKRHYYIFRNRFYYNRKYLKHYIICDYLQSIKQCWRILIYETNKLAKISQLYKALYDYKNNLMGKGRY